MSKQHCRLECLEGRSLLAGNCTAAVVAGDLVIIGDLEPNSLEIRQVGVGSYQVAGLNGTLVNGAPSFVANQVKDDFRIDMAQHGQDLVKLTGAMRVPDRLDVIMGEGGKFQILGTEGLVKIGGVTDIRSGAPAELVDITIQDQVQFIGKVDITGGGTVNIESRGALAGPIFTDPVTIHSAEDVNIQSFDNSTGPRFKKSLTMAPNGPIATVFDAHIASHGASVGPRFDGAVQGFLGESIRIESTGTSAGATFKGPVNIRAAINIIIQSFGVSAGPQFRGPVTLQPADDVFIRSNDQSRGPEFTGNSTFIAGVGVIIWSDGGSVGPLFKGKVDMHTGYDVLIWSFENSVGPTFKQPLNIQSVMDVSIQSWHTSVGPSFYAPVTIDTGTSVHIGAVFDGQGATFRAPVYITAAEDLIIQRVAGASSSASFAALQAIVGGNALVDRAKFSGKVTVQMADDDNLLRVVDSIFAKGLSADGGLGTDTFENGGGNSFLGGLTLLNFEITSP